MYVLKIASMIILVLYALAMLFFAVRTHKPFRSLFFTALIGVFALVLVSLTSKVTGLSMNINPFTASVSAAGGVPGIIGLVLLKMYF